MSAGTRTKYKFKITGVAHGDKQPLRIEFASKQAAGIPGTWVSTGIAHIASARDVCYCPDTRIGIESKTWIRAKRDGIHAIGVGIGLCAQDAYPEKTNKRVK